MAEKKNIENEIENELKNEANVLQGNNIDEEFVDAFESENSNARIIDSEKVFLTKYPVQRGKPSVVNGKSIENYAVGFMVTINGEKIPHVMHLRAKGGGENGAKLLNNVMSCKGEHKLEIVKRSMRDSKTNQVNHIYSMQVSGTTDEGYLLVSPLEPLFTVDKSIFANFKTMLLHRGCIE